MDGDGEDAPVLLVTGNVFGDAVLTRRSLRRRPTDWATKTWSDLEQLSSLLSTRPRVAQHFTYRSTAET
jgi:hypothetical protein